MTETPETTGTTAGEIEDASNAPSRWRWLGWSLAAVVVILGVRFFEPLAALVKHGPQAQSAANRGPGSERAVPVEAASVELGNLDVVASYPGELATDTADLAARVAGPVIDVTVRMGDRVAQGDLLAVIDPAPMQREAKQLEAAVRATAAGVRGTAAQLETAKKELARGHQLEDVIAAQELDELATRVATLEAQLAASKAQGDEASARLGVLKQQIADSRVRAPFDAIVALRNVDPGDYVPIGQALMRLVADGPLRVEFRIPERDIGKLAVDAPMTVRAQASNAIVEGVITRFSAEVDRTNRTLAVEGRIERVEPLRPGMYAEVSVLVETLRDVLVVPGAAVLDRIDSRGQRTSGVFTVSDDTTARWVPVETLGDRNGRKAIRGEVAVGSKVLVRGHQDLADGTKVSVITSSQPANVAAPKAPSTAPPSSAQPTSIGPRPPIGRSANDGQRPPATSTVASPGPAAAGLGEPARPRTEP